MLGRPESLETRKPASLLDQSDRLGTLGLALLAGCFAYVLTFAQVGFPLVKAIEFAVLSVLSACIPGAAVWSTTTRMQSLAPTLQAALHVPLSLGYSWAWYIIGRWLGAAIDVARGYNWAIGWLPDNALAWQLTQGLTVYAAIAAAAYAVSNASVQAQTSRLDDVAAGSPVREAEPRTTRFLAKAGDGFTSINVDEIIIIEGADDYSEVTVDSGEQRLVRLSLKAFEAQLDPTNFVRIHRSALIALDRLISAEPAGGGRMLLHLPAGRVVRTSREGARKLRARMI